MKPSFWFEMADWMVGAPKPESRKKGSMFDEKTKEELILENDREMQVFLLAMEFPTPEMLINELKLKGKVEEEWFNKALVLIWDSDATREFYALFVARLRKFKYAKDDGLVGDALPTSLIKRLLQGIIKALTKCVKQIERLEASSVLFAGQRPFSNHLREFINDVEGVPWESLQAETKMLSKDWWLVALLDSWQRQFSTIQHSRQSRLHRACEYFSIAFDRSEPVSERTLLSMKPYIEACVAMHPRPSEVYRGDIPDDVKKLCRDYAKLCAEETGQSTKT